MRDQGFEVGVHTWDHVLWQDFVMQRDAAWTERLLTLAWERHREIFGSAPLVHCAAGWQMNAHAFAFEDQLGFQYASDTRGTAPFRPRAGGRATRAATLWAPLALRKSSIACAGGNNTLSLRESTCH